VERIDLRVGEERAVHLPPGDWTVRVEGMSSAVSARKLWPADPYPDDDEDDQAPRPPPDVVFMIRGTAPGTATLRFEPVGRSAGSAHDIQLEVRL
jgi:hypothetical protein